MSSKRFAAPYASDSRNRASASPNVERHARAHERATNTATTKSTAQADRAAPKSPPPTRTPPSAPRPVAPEEARKPMIFEDETRGENDFASLGDLLVYLRKTYGERTGYTTHGPAFSITAQAVADTLSEYGYSMTSGSYSLLEHSQSLPKNPERFFDAICEALAVKKSSKYWVLLRYQYLYDYARRMVGEDFARDHCPRGKHALELLKQGAL